MYIAKPILLKGQIEGIDLNALSSSNYKGRLEDASIFNEIKVGGTVHFNGLVSGFNTSEICSFAYGNNTKKKLIIEGLVLRVKIKLKVR